jgi:hypothetical protein
MSAKLLQKIFKKVYGKPSWLVRQLYGSAIALEFGKPRLRIREKVIRPIRKGGYPKRMVMVCGDWHLTTFCCDWDFRQGKRKICNSNSKVEKIDRGCAILDGKILIKAVVNLKDLVTDFYFDLGGHLQTKPWKNESKPFDMWDLFCPDGKVFSLRSDGKYSFQRGDTPPQKKTWQPFTV